MSDAIHISASTKTITLESPILEWDADGLYIWLKYDETGSQWYLCKSGIAHFGYSERYVPVPEKDGDGDYNDSRITVGMSDGTTYVLLYRESCGYIFNDFRVKLRRGRPSST